MLILHCCMTMTKSTIKMNASPNSFLQLRVHKVCKILWYKLQLCSLASTYTNPTTCSKTCYMYIIIFSHSSVIDSLYYVWLIYKFYPTGFLVVLSLTHRQSLYCNSKHLRNSFLRVTLFCIVNGMS